MGAPVAPRRSKPWLEGLGDWAWPGRAGAVRELRPPVWVPSLPPARAPALAGLAAGIDVPSRAPSRAPAMLPAALSAVAALAAIAALAGAAGVEGVLGGAPGRRPLPAVSPAPPAPPPVLEMQAPVLAPVLADAAGGSVEHASFRSASLQGEGSFLVYLPPGYMGGTRRYPVLYLLHGRDGHASSFLEIGIQAHLDRLIDERELEPMIVVMPQDLPGLDNWRDIGGRRSATYVVEVQELADRMFRTIPTRGGRAIAGSSMGGYGAMNVFLANPLRFAVVESWLGFFNGLEWSLQADRPVISRLGLHAFLYGAAADPVAVPAEDPEFAAELRVEGAHAASAIYPGGHSLEKVEEHLDTGLRFAGRSLLASEREEALRSGA